MSGIVIEFGFAIAQPLYCCKSRLLVSFIHNDDRATTGIPDNISPRLSYIKSESFANSNIWNKEWQ
jgi:hypothetical protein